MVTDELARFAATVQAQDLPHKVRETCAASLMDTVGVIFAANRFAGQEGMPELDRYLEAIGTGGSAALLGTNLTASPAVAAFVNGTRAEFLDWQDTHAAARLHSSVGTVPALLAAAAETSVTGSDFMAGLVAAYEVGARIASAMQPSHWYRGFQATGTVGAIGAAAGLGRMLGLDTGSLTNVLGIAGFIAPVSNGDGVFQGYTIKPAHAGMAAQSALQAVALARAGYAAGPLEGLPPRYHGFMRVTTDIEGEIPSTVDGLGSTWSLLETFYKIYPAGSVMSPAIELTSRIVTDASLPGDQIEAIEVYTWADAAHFLGEHPTDTHSTFIDCHFSFGYTIAVTAMDGEFGLAQLTRERIKDPQVHDLARKVRVIVDPALTARFANWPGRVCIVTRDGQRLEAAVASGTGSRDTPASLEQLRAKFLTNTEAALGRSRAEDAADALLDVESANDMGDVLALLEISS